ncbi:hypothetical protein BU23DRAFT_469093 [Bimuria novae-zelandiae CBS 107.79]|uniref:Uncharacterized protein n=1 Tax=Bimuria novae-zelandiae CBS 107.79 TaxID=1447943 RepID=A0A6A5V4V3_9PLEO|nr:hypothetical protein BU23DRAFT_469093 [Bimuria novae-zelandiae CBS 107.79]
MANHIFRKGGIPVLASLAPDISLPISCALDAKHSEAQQQAAIVLHFRMSISGFDDEQPVALLYHADNLFDSGPALQPAAVSLPQALLDQITRNKGDLRILALNLKTPSVVRCPRSTGTIAPQKVPDMRFRQLVGLAKATRLYILFDYEWLHPARASRFLQIVSRPASLSAFTAEDHASVPLQQADWTVFSPDTDATSEAPPPAYADSFNKRHRSPTSSPRSPPPKRVLLSPAPIFPLSPTEKATPTTVSPSLSPRPLFQPNAPGFEEVLKNVLEKLMPSAPSIEEAEMTQDLLEHTTDLCNTAQVDFQEDLEDHKVEVTMIKEDGLNDINRLFDDKLEEFRESAAGIVESVECEVKLERSLLAREREQLEQERRRAHRTRFGDEFAIDRARRAASVP